jgi:GAF domain-containing protein
MTHPEMTSFQSIAQNLLLETAASRVMLQLNAPGSGFLPAAEAVSHGARQIRHDAASGPVFDLPAIERAGGQDELLVQNDLLLDESPAASTLSNRYGVRSQVVAPLVHGGRLAGAIAVHHVGGATQWGDEEIAAVRKSQAGACRLLDERNRQVLSCSLESLRDAGIQALLDRVRSGLGVQRCTLRQNVSAAYAFPVTHESRAQDVWSLLGDFTIVQNGQPVIEKLLRDRAQVVQDDSRAASTEPHFHVMLKHYGDMRAQIVTPLFREDSLAAVLSIHSLGQLRSWTPEETALARSAARLLGLLVGATLA